MAEEETVNDVLLKTWQDWLLLFVFCLPIIPFAFLGSLIGTILEKIKAKQTVA